MPPYKNKKNDLHFFKNMFIIVLSPWWWRNQINAHIDEKVLHFGMISRMNRDCELVLLRLQATLSLWTCARCITRALWCATRCPCWVTAFSGTCLPRAKENAGWDRSDTTMPVWDRDAKKKVCERLGMTCIPLRLIEEDFQEFRSLQRLRILCLTPFCHVRWCSRDSSMQAWWCIWVIEATRASFTSCRQTRCFPARGTRHAASQGKWLGNEKKWQQKAFFPWWNKNQT